MSLARRTVDALGLDADQLTELLRCANEETTSARLEVEALRAELDLAERIGQVICSLLHLGPEPAAVAL